MKPVLRTAVILLSALVVSAVAAAPPKIARLSVRGLQTGATTRIAIQGTDLLPEPKLLIPEVNIAEQKLVGTPKANAIEFDVTLDKSVAAGVYHLRLATPAGLTPPEIVAIDHLPQHAVGAGGPNAAAEKLPVAVHGLINGAQVQETKFEGKKGQAITVDVLAQRLGAKLRPVVTLVDAAGRQLASGLPASHLLGDARFDVTLPADGVYTLAVHDLAYAGATPGHYRLSIGRFDYVDQVFPPVVSQTEGQSDGATEGRDDVELVGRFGNSTVSKIDVSELGASGSSATPLPWPAGSQPIGLRPRIERGLADVVEDRTLEHSRKVPLDTFPLKVAPFNYVTGKPGRRGRPMGVSARLLKPGEEDVFHFAVEPGQKWRFEVLGARIGSPIDASLELRGAKGARLAQNDDAPGVDARTTVPDPQLEYTVAAGVTEVTAVVTDAYRRGGPDMIYRLVATRLDGPEFAAGDFSLRLFEDTHLVAAGGSKVFRVEVDRRGYDGPIRLVVQGLPGGITAQPTEIGAGANAALVEIRGPAKLPAFAVGQITVVGETVADNTVSSESPGKTEVVKRAVRRTAVVGTAPLRTLQPWLAADVAIAPATFAHEFGVEWDVAAAGPHVAAAGPSRPVSEKPASDKPASDKTAVAAKSAAGTAATTSDVEAPEEKALLGKDRKLTVRFRRGPGAIGPIRLSLLTSQVPVLVNGQPNPMQVLRGPAATVDVPLDGAVKQAFDAHAAAEKGLAALEAAPAPKDKKSDAKQPDPKREADLKAARAKVDEAAKKLAEAQAKLKPTFDYTLTIPADLAMIPHDVCIKAELRSLDNQTTLAEAFAPIKKLAISAPVELVMTAGAPEVKEAPRGATAVTIRGQIVRLEDFAGDATVTVVGLPTGIAAPRQVLKAKEETFALEITVPATFAGKSLEGLKVTAQVVPDARRANVTATIEKKLAPISLKVPAQVAAAVKAEPAKTEAAKPAAVAKPAAKPDPKKPAAAKPAEKKPAEKKAAVPKK